MVRAPFRCLAATSFLIATLAGCVGEESGTLPRLSSVCNGTGFAPETNDSVPLEVSVLNDNGPIDLAVCINGMILEEVEMDSDDEGGILNTLVPEGQLVVEIEEYANGLRERQVFETLDKNYVHIRVAEDVLQMVHQSAPGAH